MNLKIKFLLTYPLLCLPLSCMAENVYLNQLLEISKNNFCYQNNTTYRSIENYFKINNQSELNIMKTKILSMKVGQPVLEINETGEHLKSELLKYDSKKYTPYDISNIEIKNIYSITHTADIEVPLMPFQLITLIAKNYPGIKLNPENYSGQFNLMEGTRPDFNKANNTKEFNQLLENVNSSKISFTIRPANQNSVLSYRCQMTILTNKSPQEIGNEIVRN